MRVVLFSEVCESYVLEVPGVDFIGPCGVVFAMFYCRLDLCCGEVTVFSLKVVVLVFVYSEFQHGK